MSVSKDKVEIVMSYDICIERGEEGYGVYVPGLLGCVAVGDTREEAKKLICEAIKSHVEGIIADGDSDVLKCSRCDKEMGSVILDLPGVCSKCITYDEARKAEMPVRLWINKGKQNENDS